MSNLFANNSDIKYPLSDFHESDIPNSIFTGLSLSVPEGVKPRMTGLRVGDGFVFVLFEDSDTELPVGSLFMANPEPGRIYPLDMDVAGFGWVMFGPGVYDEVGFYLADIVELDPETIIPDLSLHDVFTITVNGVSYTLETFLEFFSDSSVLSLSISGDTLYIDRNDAVLDDISRSNFTDNGSASTGGEDPRIFTIDDVFPDENGNIDININGCIERCDEVNDLELPRGDEFSGEYGILPLNEFFEKVYAPGDPCAPSGSSESSGEPEEPLCQDIIKETIYNEDSKDVGTLYKGDT
jgi:hypothetical protein